MDLARVMQYCLANVCQQKNIRKEKINEEGSEMIIKRMFDFPNYGWRSTFDNLERVRREMDRHFGQSAGQTYWPTHAGVFPLVNVTQFISHPALAG